MPRAAPTSVPRPRAGAAAALALPALLALLALPRPAVALRWRACRDASDARCAGVRVPLDRSGVQPGSIRLRVARAGRRSGPTLMYLSGGPGGAGVTEMLDVIATVPQLA